MESSRRDAPSNAKEDVEQGGRPSTSPDINLQEQPQNPQSITTEAAGATPSHQSPVSSQGGGNSFL